MQKLICIGYIRFSSFWGKGRMWMSDYWAAAYSTNFLTTTFMHLVGPDLPQIDGTTYSVTSQGYSVLEKRNISLICQASSNPPSQYIWFYNNSEIYSGPQLTITNILRVDTGHYTCLAQNTFLNTRSKKTITLTIYCEFYNTLLCLWSFCVFIIICHYPITWTGFPFRPKPKQTHRYTLRKMIKLRTLKHSLVCPSGEIRESYK